MDIQLDRKNMTASVIKDGKVLRSQELEPEEFKETMHELVDKADMDIDAIRKIAKLFKVKCFNFKDIV